MYKRARLYVCVYVFWVSANYSLCPTFYPRSLALALSLFNLTLSLAIAFARSLS